VAEDRPDEVRLRRAGEVLSEFGTLWRNPVIPDRLREEALREIFGRFDVDGPEILAAYPQPNENAWLLGLVAAREQRRLLTQRVMGLVGARGIAPSCLTQALWSDSCVRTTPGSTLTRLDGSAKGAEPSRRHGPRTPGARPVPASTVERPV
jgi:hypothetical protein